MKKKTARLLGIVALVVLVALLALPALQALGGSNHFTAKVLDQGVLFWQVEVVSHGNTDLPAGATLSIPARPAGDISPGDLIDVSTLLRPGSQTTLLPLCKATRHYLRER